MQIDMNGNKVDVSDAILDSNARILNLYVTCTKSYLKVIISKKINLLSKTIFNK